MPDFELKIPPVAQVIVCGFAMWLLATTLSVAHLRIPFGPELFFLLVFLGFSMAIAGVLEFRKASTTVDPRFPHESSKLVVGGIYRISRNPMYLGMVLVLIAYGLHLANAIAFLMIPLFILCMNRLQIVPEERAMRKRFGDQYQTYSARVRRWI